MGRTMRRYVCDEVAVHSWATDSSIPKNQATMSGKGRAAPSVNRQFTDTSPVDQAVASFPANAHQTAPAVISLAHSPLGGA